MSTVGQLPIEIPEDRRPVKAAGNDVNSIVVPTVAGSPLIEAVEVASGIPSVVLDLVITVVPVILEVAVERPVEYSLTPPSEP